MIKSALLLLLSAAPLLAQSERTAALGDRVRIRAPKAGYGRITGQVIATTPDVVQLRIDGGGTEVAVQRGEIEELLLSVKSRRNTTRGIVIGAVAGGALAYVFGPRKQETAYSAPGTRTPTVNIVTTAVGGAAIGGLIGYYTRTDSWMRLSARP
jgi:hypothetical protein